MYKDSKYDGKVTIKEVAKLAGVSSSTVSRALSGRIPVDQKTKDKVLAAVKELNYQPNALAKGLKEGRTKTMGLIVPNICNPVFPLVSRGVEDTAKEHGYSLVLCNTDEDPDTEKEAIQKLQKQWVDGIILATSGREKGHIEKLNQSGLPMVLLIRKLADDMDAVVINNTKAAFDAVSYLVETGHRRIAIVNGDRSLPLYQERYKGYVQALEKSDIPLDASLILEVSDKDSCYDTASRFFKSGIAVDAVFAVSDPRALEVMRAAKDAGIIIPGEVSVMGFDNLQFSPFLDPPLTTVNQPFYEMGQAAAERVIALIEGESGKARIHVLDTELVIRKSVMDRAGEISGEN
jgi:LacI family transcriptional regulator